MGGKITPVKFVVAADQAVSPEGQESINALKSLPEGKRWDVREVSPGRFRPVQVDKSNWFFEWLREIFGTSTRDLAKFAADFVTANIEWVKAEDITALVAVARGKFGDKLPQRIKTLSETLSEITKAKQQPAAAAPSAPPAAVPDADALRLREEAVTKKEAALAAREAAAPSTDAEALRRREEEVARREAAALSKESVVSTREGNLSERERNVGARESAAQRREAELLAREAAAAIKPSGAAGAADAAQAGIDARKAEEHRQKEAQLAARESQVAEKEAAAARAIDAAADQAGSNAVTEQQLQERATALQQREEAADRRTSELQNKERLIAEAKAAHEAATKAFDKTQRGVQEQVQKLGEEQRAFEVQRAAFEATKATANASGDIAAQLAAMQADLAQKSAELVEAKAQAAKLQELRNELEAADKLNRELGAKEAGLNARIEELQRLNANHKREHERAIADESGRLAARNRSALAAVEDKASKFEVSCKDKDRELENLRGELENLRGELAALEKEKKSNEAKVNSLTEKLSQHTEIIGKCEAAVSQFEAQISAQQQEYGLDKKKLEGEKATIAEQLELTKQSLATATAESEARINALDLSEKALKKQVADLEKALSEEKNKTYQQGLEIETQREAIEALRAQNAELVAQAKAKEGELAAVSGQLGDATAELEGLRTRLSSAQETARSSQEGHAQARARIGELEAEVRAKEAQVVALTKEVAALRAQVAALTKEADALRADVAELDAVGVQKSKECEQLEIDLRKEADKLAAAQIQLHNLRSGVVSATASGRTGLFDAAFSPVPKEKVRTPVANEVDLVDDSYEEEEVDGDDLMPGNRRSVVPQQILGSGSFEDGARGSPKIKVGVPRHPGGPLPREALEELLAIQVAPAAAARGASSTHSAAVVQSPAPAALSSATRPVPGTPSFSASSGKTGATGTAPFPGTPYPRNNNPLASALMLSAGQAFLPSNWARAALDVKKTEEKPKVPPKTEEKRKDAPPVEEVD